MQKNIVSRFYQPKVTEREIGSDEYLEMIKELNNVESSIYDCKTAIEQFDNAIVNIHYEVIEKVSNQFSNLSSEISHLSGLFDNDDVATKDNKWTKSGLVRLGLETQAYELAQYQSQMYAKAIDQLNKDYLAGKFSTMEYSEKLADLTEKQWSSIEAAESAKDAIMQLNQARVDIVVEGINEEIKAYQELIKSAKDALASEKDLHDYEKSIAESTKSITDLERQIAAMQNDNTAATIAKRKKLEEELSKAKEELAEKEYQHSIEQQQKELDESLENFEKEKNDEIEKLKDSLKEQEIVLSDSFSAVKQNAELIGQQIVEIANTHGVTVSGSLITAWQSGENAIAAYGETLSSQSSVFIGNIQNVENKVWALQKDADETSKSLSAMFANKADTLVAELNNSWTNVANVKNMVDSLKASLYDTLCSGYDASGIINSLNAIANAANTAKTAINNMGDNPSTPNESAKYKVVDNGKTLKEGFPTEYSAMQYIKYTSGLSPYAHIEKYAKGGQNLSRQLAWTQELGREAILSPSNNAILTPISNGDSVLTKAMTDNLWDWAKINPISLLNPKLPTASANSGSVNIHYDNLVRVDGDVNNSNIKQIQETVMSAVDKQFNKLNTELYKRGVR